jgi:hypothetical protein
MATFMLVQLVPSHRPKGTARQRKHTMRKRKQLSRKRNSMRTGAVTGFAAGDVITGGISGIKARITSITED